METTLDEAGRIPIPKEVLVELGLRPGVKLDIEAADGAMTIKLSDNTHSPETNKPESKLVWEDSVLVYHGEWRPTVADVNRLIQNLDEERDRKLWNPE
jgi:bifunctional DNA-binding transcriptional regulator/antitoxin component of YhaV-PrlF toxin-antitoxin module